MYYTKAEDLARMANDLDQLARKYNQGAQELDQQTAGLDGVTQQLIAGGPDHWLGVSSDAFQGAWEERRARMQQVSQILTQSAQRFTQFAQTIEEHLPTIRADQAIQQSSGHMMLGPDDQKSILDEESQAQNAIVSALALFNSQLEQLAEEIKDCPQERENANAPGYGNDPNNINRNDSGGGAGKGSSGESGDDAGGTDAITPEGRRITGHARDDSLPRHKMTPKQVDDVIDNYSRKTNQRDGATVYIKKQAGRGQKYSLVIEGDSVIVTAMRDLSRDDLAHLGKNYGFNPNP